MAPAVDGSRVWLEAGAPWQLMLAVCAVHYVAEWCVRIKLLLGLRRALKDVAAPREEPAGFFPPYARALVDDDDDLDADLSLELV